MGLVAGQKMNWIWNCGLAFFGNRIFFEECAICFDDG
jgi:hypothetical protein